MKDKEEKREGGLSADLTQRVGKDRRILDFFVSMQNIGFSHPLI